ncbi:MAG TPA: MerR family transcriptional regulator [Candidatus Hypogeohydataceae bacterium YC41]
MTNFNTQTVCSIIGITPRQVQYWDETNFIKPSVRRATGYGSSRLYSFLDLVQMRVAKTLLDGGVTLQKIRKSLEYLRAHAPEVKKPLAELRFLTDGDTVFVLTADKEKIVDALKNGQLVFSVALGDLVRDLNSRVQKFIITNEVPVRVGGLEFKVLLESNPDGTGFTASCPSLGRLAVGETEEQAVEALKQELERGIIKEVKEKTG